MMAQDIVYPHWETFGYRDLTGNPQITFFKVVYRRHTNFAIESIEQTFNGTADFGKRVTSTISRNGDLIWKVYLQVDLPAIAKAGGTVAWVRSVGHYLINNVELEIGGQRIDKQYADWLHLWQELTIPPGQVDGFNVMIGNTTALTTPAASLPQTRLYVPLQFWFNRNPGLALPLIALQYHEVKVNMEFEQLSNLVITDDGADFDNESTTSLVAASLYVDYIYLDTDERRRFAQVSHEYLIEQLQFTGDESVAAVNNKLRLNFNHPVKYLVFVTRLDANVAANVLRWSDYTDGSPPYGGADHLVDAKLQLNGHDRFSVRQAAYFNLVQPYQHMPNIPATGIYVYSFALSPIEHQPSGTVNMSRIDNATLLLTLANANATTVKIYAVNYNVLRIMSGMGGLAYSN